MSKGYFFMRVLAAVGVALASAFVSAQAPAGAERPTPNVGDVWKLRTIDLWNNNELSTTHSELVEARADRLVFHGPAGLQFARKPERRDLARRRNGRPKDQPVRARFDELAVRR